MIGQGVPALTGDSPGAQEIDITDTADTFKGYQATPPVPDAGCVIVSAHEARCYASRSEQLGWRASHCNFPPGCTGPGPSGLLDMFVASLSGQRTNYQDTPGSTPIQQSVSTFGSGQVSLWNGGQNTLYLGGPYQSGVLRPGSGPTSASTGSGNVYLDARNGQADRISCGSGQSLILADQQSYVDPSCTNVFRF
jgi:hypothetical protein